MLNEKIHNRNRSGISVFLLAFFLLLNFHHSKAQQLPHFTQYMFNDFLINPAITGTYSYYQIRMLSRYQWVGIKDAPKTYSLSMYGPMVDKDMGVGGFLYMDQTGPTSRLAGYGSYAYNVGITSTMRLSMGASLGFLQAKYDLTGGNFKDKDDVVVSKVYSDLVPDASFGIYVYDWTWYAGFAAHQLVGNKLTSFDDKDRREKEYLGLNKLKTHYYLMGGYRYTINRDFLIEPLVIVRYVGPSLPQVDFAVKLNYQNMFWGGISYRSQDAITVMVGYNHEQKFKFGYSYDISLTPIRKFNTGTHEVMIGVQFEKLK